MNQEYFLFVALILMVFSAQYQTQFIFPLNNLWIYTYRGIVQTGIQTPENAHSQWEIDSAISIKSFSTNTNTEADNGTFIILQLLDVKLSIFNGPNEHYNSDELERKSLANIGQITEPFIIKYNSTNGLIESIFLNPSEDLWSVNIKRAIGSLFQIDTSSSQPAFRSVEKNLYGTCITDNNIQKDRSSNITRFHKFIDHSKCDDFPLSSWSSASQSLCLVHNEHAYTQSNRRHSIVSSSKRIYTLETVFSSRTNENGVFSITKLDATGELFLQQTFDTKNSDAYSSKTWQEIKLIKVRSYNEDINATLSILRNLNETSLRFQHDSQNLITLGRPKATKAAKIASIKFAIEQLMLTFESDNLHTENSNSKLLQMLYFEMRTLDSSALHQIYADLGLGTSYRQETKANIFIEILPQIGTRASILFIIELIVSRNIKDITAVKLLATLPFYYSFNDNNDNSEEDLTAFEPLLNLDVNVFTPHVHHAAVLSFATLVYKTFAAERCSVRVFEKYARRYFNQFAISETYEQRLLYLQGLNNLQLGSVTQFLRPVISSNSGYEDHIRFLAVWATMSRSPLFPLEVFETYWPILINPKEHLEMRIAAFKILLISEPSHERILSLFWFMNEEKDPHLYHFYYSTLLSIQHTTYPCYVHLRPLAAQIIRYIQPKINTGKYWMTGNYLFDYVDKKRSFGAMLQLLLIGNPKTDRLNVFYLTINNYMTGRNVNQFALYLKLNGVSESISDKISTIIDNHDTNKLDRLIELLKKLISKEEMLERMPDSRQNPVHVEIIAQIEGKTVYCRHFNETTFNQIHLAILQVQSLKSEYHVNYQHVGVTLANRELRVNDLGTLSISDSTTIVLASLRGNFTYSLQEAAVARRNDLDFRYSFNIQQTLWSYNPFLETVHGVERQRIVQGDFPLITSISFDIEKWEAIAIWEELQHERAHPNLYFHTRVLTFVRMFNRSGFISNLLPEFCLSCFKEHVLNGDRNHNFQGEIFNLTSIDLARNIKMTIFDCDHSAQSSYYDLMNLYSEISFSHQSNYNVWRPSKYLLFIQHASDYIGFMPGNGRCGLSIVIEPISKNRPTIIAKLSANRKKFTNESMHLENTLFNLKLIQQKTLFNQTNNLVEIVNIHMLNIDLITKNIIDEEQCKIVPNCSGLFQLKLDIQRSLHQNEDEQILLDEDGQEKKSHTFSIDTITKYPLFRRERDLLALKPMPAILQTGTAVWYGNSDVNSSSIQWNIVTELTERQVQIANQARKWPFKQCKKSLKNNTFTPLIEECFQASILLATPQKLTSVINYQNMPLWFNDLIYRVKYALGDHLVENDANKSQLNTTFMYTNQDQALYLFLDSKKIILPFKMYLPNIRYSHWASDFNLEYTCVMTKSSIKTIYNKSIELTSSTHRNDSKPFAVLLADCSTRPKFALINTEVILEMDRSTLEMATSNESKGHSVMTPLTFYSSELNGGNVTFSVNVVEDQEIVEVLVNGEENTHHEKFIIWHQYSDVVEIENSFGGIRMRYTPEYVLVSVPGYLKAHCCGLCCS